MTATDEVQLETEAKARLAPPPRWPPTAIGAGALPLPPPRQQPRATPRRLYLLVYLIRRPGLLKTLATGLMLGAFAAITRLGPHPFSLRGVVPILTAGFALGPQRPEHAAIRVGLAVAFGRWARRWRPRPGETELTGGSELQDRFEALEGDVSKLRQELSETQERVDFVERLLAQGRDA